MDSKIVVLGSGLLSGLITNHLYKKNIEHILLGDNFNLYKMNVNGDIFNPIPVFPPDDFLSNNYNAPILLKKMHHINDNIMETLSSKLFNDKNASDIHYEIKCKIERQYNSVQRSRLGYCNGLSPYYLEACINHDAHIISTKVRSIDIESRRVYMDDNSSIKYSKLLSTLPLPYICQLTNINNKKLKFNSVHAHFMIFLYENAGANTIHYDCSPDTLIYRFFSPKEGVLVVQLSYQAAFPNDLERITKELFVYHDIRCTQFIKYLKNDIAYPVSTTGIDFKNKLLENLQNNNVFSIGRYARWEYKDIHELNWEILDEIY